jgi:hypothetical protein
MESRTQVSAEFDSGARLTVDVRKDGYSVLDLLGAKDVTVQVQGTGTRYVTVRAKGKFGLADVTVLLPLGYAAAIGAAAEAELERLAGSAATLAAERASVGATS